jgi:Uma2 family endonuclease
MIIFTVKIGMSDAVKILPYYTYEDYLQWEGKWELIEGIPYAMSPAPAPKHQRIAANLTTCFAIALKNCSNGKVYQPVDYILQDDTVLQPDMLIVCHEIKKRFLDFPPALVAEILLPSTALKDRHTKYSLYQSQIIRYYILIDPDAEEAELYELENSSYKLKQKGRDFTYEFFLEECSAIVNFREVW